MLNKEMLQFDAQNKLISNLMLATGLKIENGKWSNCYVVLFYSPAALKVLNWDRGMFTIV